LLKIRVHLHSFSCYCLRNTKNVAKFQENAKRIWPYSSSRSSKVIDLGVNRMPIRDFLLVIITLAVSATVFEIFTLENGKLLILPTPSLFDAQFQRIHRWKVHLVGYNSVAYSTGLSPFVLPLLASKIEKSRGNSDKIWPYSSSRSSKVIDLGVNRKLTCDFLLVTNSNSNHMCYRFSRWWGLKIENCWFYPPLPCLTLPLGVTLFEFCDEIWRQKTGIVGLYQTVKKSWRFHTIPAREGQMDRETDRQTRCCRKYPL